MNMLNSQLSQSLSPQALTMEKKENGGNLIPLKKGMTANKKGRPVGSISLKHRLEKLLTKSSADQIINELIDMAKSGSIQHTKLVCELTGDLNASAPQLTINNNTLISSDIIEMARAFLSDQSPVSASIINI
jgi:hypothetical protein